MQEVGGRDEHKTVPQKTLLFLYVPERKEILLAMKKRGFGEGKWNGVGGKVEKGESPREAVVRETMEEIEVVVDEAALQERGLIHFSFEGKPELTQDVLIFFSTEWKGTPVETEEMRPQWYAYKAIPYDDMWVDDHHWLPEVLAGKYIEASFLFSSSGDRLKKKSISYR